VDPDPAIPVDDLYLHAALLFAQAGCPVFPVAAGSKKPMKGSHGYLDATRDPEMLKSWWRQHPGANIAMPTGQRSAIVVFDWDGATGVQTRRRLVEEHGPLPRARTHLTGSGKGLQDLFAYVDGIPSSVKAIEDAPGLDVLAEGRYFVVPPSIGPARRYWSLPDRCGSWFGMSEPPAWLVDLARTSTSSTSTGKRFELPMEIPKGTRDDTLFKYGCHLRTRGWEHGAILAELRRVNRERCRPTPISDREVRQKARSAAKYPAGDAKHPTNSIRRPKPYGEILATIAYLEELARHRRRTGGGAYSTWSVYMALLDLAKNHGFLVGVRDVGVSVSVRQLALKAGMAKSTAQEAWARLRESGLVYRADGGEGTDSGALALRVPLRRDPVDGGALRRGSVDSALPYGDTSVPTSDVLPDPLYRSRYGAGMLGKAASVTLDALVSSGETMTRSEIAAATGKRPDRVGRDLATLRKRGLVEKVGHGRYRVSSDWQTNLATARVVDGEERLEDQQRERHARESRAYSEFLLDRGEKATRPWRGAVTAP
jgi:putative DNA primase/helicase